MKFPFSRFFVITLCWFASVPDGSEAQPWQWHVYPQDGGSPVLSVKADSLIYLGNKLFAAISKQESILFSETPLQPVLRKDKTTFQKLNKDFFLAKSAGQWSLYSYSNPGRPVMENAREFQSWKNMALMKTDTEWLLFKNGAEPVRFDSAAFSSEKLILFQPKGILCLDSQKNEHFIHAAAAIRVINYPWNSSILCDSLWIPLKPGGKMQRNLPGSVWWNEQCLLDTGITGWHMQDLSGIRKKIGDAGKILGPDALWLKSGGKEFILFSGGRRVSVPPSSDQKMIGDSLYALRLAGNWMLLDYKGRQYQIKKEVSEVISGGNGVVLVKSGKRWGCTDLSGIIRISCRYDSLLPIKDRRIAAKIGSLWGFLDQEERIIVQPNYEIVSSFRDSAALVKRNRKWGLLKVDGGTLLECEFDAVIPLRNKLWKVKKGNWFGIYGPAGNFLLNTRYSDIIETQSGLFQVERDGKKGLFSERGKLILPLEFQQIIPDPPHRILICR
jgi:hypothetical protein